MCFRLVPKSVTLNDLNDLAFSPYSVAFRADYVKVIKRYTVCDRNVAQRK